VNQRFALALLAGALLAACVPDDDVLPDDDFAELAGLDEKADGFAAAVRLVGELDYGQAPLAAAYAGAPRYVGVRFRATMGDRIDARVAAAREAPVAWILDEDFQIVSTGQETTSTADGRREGHVRLVVGEGVDRVYYVMARTAGLAPDTLTIAVDGELPAPRCDEDNPVRREPTDADRPMPRAVRSTMRQQGWGCMHREWHAVRLLDSLVGLEAQYVRAYHPEWTAVQPQEGGAGNGLEFLAMHRVMLAELRATFPGWADDPALADLAGWPVGGVPTAVDDPAWPVPAPARPFDARMLGALARLEAGDGFVDDDDFGRYLETNRRPEPGAPWLMSTDRSTGFHNYMHGRYNDAQSPIRMGNVARNIEGRTFWRLHGWIDAVWTDFRRGRGIADDAADATYMQAMHRACIDMMRGHGHPAPDEARWDVTAARCLHRH
jgi:hypothetical protein